MKRNVSLSEISDGRLYELNDMVKADCGDCKGCSDCCHGMGDTVVLDPYDIFRLTTGLGVSFSELLMEKVSLGVVDGIVLPHLNMDNKSGACGFLDKNGRCAIHSVRPGICRLFPLGRYYEENGFKYFLQKNECKNASRTKVKVKKWIDTPNPTEYERFVLTWHRFLEQHEEDLKSMDENGAKTVSMNILNLFYLSTYGSDRDFYEQFNERMEKYYEKA